MKKTQFFLCVAGWLIGLSVGNAQSTKPFRVGLTGGVNAGMIKKRIGVQDILWAYNAGLTAEYRFSAALALNAQLLYSRQGEIVRNRVLPYERPSWQIIRFDYVTLPLMLRFRPIGERAFVQAGGQIGYMVGNSFRMTTQPNQVRPFNHTQAIDLGLTGGIGYRLGKHVVVDARYYHGMRSLFRGHNRVDPQTGQVTWVRQSPWYNRVTSLNLSYYF